MEKELLITSLTDLIDKIIEAMREYILTFDIFDSFKFSPNEDDINKIHTHYRELTAKLTSLSEKTDDIAANIASLTCEADNLMNLEDILFFSKRLDTYTNWRSALASFLQKNDAIFSRTASDISIASLINLVKIFSNETDLLKNSLKFF